MAHAAPPGWAVSGPPVLVPELLEVETYPRAAETVVGRTIDSVIVPDTWYLKRGLTPAVVTVAAPGATVERVRRRGKLLLVDTDGPVLGLRFGMTGRLIVDGLAAIDQLEYASIRDEPAWKRFALGSVSGGSLRLDDPLEARWRRARPRRGGPGPRCTGDHGRPVGRGARRESRRHQGQAPGPDPVAFVGPSSPTRCSGEPGSIRRTRRQPRRQRAAAPPPRPSSHARPARRAGGSYLGDLTGSPPPGSAAVTAPRWSDVRSGAAPPSWPAHEAFAQARSSTPPPSWSGRPLEDPGSPATAGASYGRPLPRCSRSRPSAVVEPCSPLPSGGRDPAVAQTGWPGGRGGADHRAGVPTDPRRRCRSRRRARR